MLEIVNNLPRAYWLMLPPRYIMAVGAVAVQWGRFEAMFDSFTKIIARPPEAQALAQRIPGPFVRRAELMSNLAKVTFRHSPALAARVADFSGRALHLCRKRNVLIHGHHFDMGPFVEMNPKALEDQALEPFAHGEHVLLMSKADGTGDIYKVEVSQVEQIAEDINSLLMEGVFIFFPPGPSAQNPILAPEERSALQAYHTEFPGDAAEAPARRDPRRKGTPQQPEPFRA